MTMIDRQLLSRLPLRFWIQLAVGLVVLAALAVIGYVLILAAAFIALGLGLVFQLWAWFSGRRPGRDVQPTIEGEYRVIDRDERR